MGKFDELRMDNDDLLESDLQIANDLSKLGIETRRMADEFGRIGETLDELDKEFSKVTGIDNRKDMVFLFTAIGLLCAKWIVMGQVAPLDFDFKLQLFFILMY